MHEAGGRDMLEQRVMTNRHPMTIHETELLRLADEPTLGLKFVRIMSEDGTVTVLYPAVDTHDGLVPSKGLHSLALSLLAERGYLSRVQPTPSGKKRSHIVAPPSGTTLSRGSPVAGCILNASLSTAWR